jgi:hypothetical protein
VSFITQTTLSLDETKDIVERLRQPVDRFALIAARARMEEAEALRAEIERLRAQDAAEVEAWVRGGATGARPAPRAETLAAERRYGEIAAEAETARAELSVLQMSLAEALDRVRFAGRERDAAVYPASVEAAAQLIEHMKAAIEVVLRDEAALSGLMAELRRIGDRDCDDALRAREAIETMVRKGKREPGVPIDFAAGRRLIEALKLDATAELRASPR